MPEPKPKYDFRLEDMACMVCGRPSIIMDVFGSRCHKHKAVKLAEIMAASRTVTTADRIEIQGDLIDHA